MTDIEYAKWRKTVACPAADFGLPPCAAVVTTYGYSTHEPSGEEDEDEGFYRHCKCLEAFGPRDIRYDDYYQRILDDLDAAPWVPVQSHAPPADGAPGGTSA